MQRAADDAGVHGGAALQGPVHMLQACRALRRVGPDRVHVHARKQRDAGGLEAEPFQLPAEFGIVVWRALEHRDLDAVVAELPGPGRPAGEVGDRVGDLRAGELPRLGAHERRVHRRRRHRP